MKYNGLGCCLWAALMLSVGDLNAAPEKEVKKKLPPQVAVVRKDGKKMMRRCFRDADKNGLCDRGSEQKGKCKNNCRKVEAEVKKSTPASEKNTAPVPGKSAPQVQNNTGKSSAVSKAVLPCSCCPLAGNCSGGCLALLRKSNTKALI